MDCDRMQFEVDGECNLDMVDVTHKIAYNRKESVAIRSRKRNLVPEKCLN